MSDVDVCKCGHVYHGFKPLGEGGMAYNGCQTYRCPCTRYESAYCPKYAAPVPRESKG